MNVEEFRTYCLSFKGVREEMPWTDKKDKSACNILCFYVMDKWFGFVDIEIFKFCNLKCDPELSEELRGRYLGIEPGWHMNKKHWISVYFDKDVPDRKIKELVKHSYDLVVKSLTQKNKKLLDDL
jgi:predicted DNA-binding protein (MmcQ/YjbR family)